MITAANCIVFRFQPKCKECGEECSTELIRLTVYDILEVGVPMCPNCETDLTLEDDCEVRA